MSNIRREWTAAEIHDAYHYSDFYQEELSEFLAEATREWAFQKKQEARVEEWRQSLKEGDK